MSRVQTSLRIDELALKKSKVILNSLGLNFTEAVNIFASMVVQEQGLPFEVKIPNKTTLQAMKEAENDEGEFQSFKDFIKEIKQ